MGDMFDLSGQMATNLSDEMARAFSPPWVPCPPQSFGSPDTPPPNIDQVTTDILHCLTHYGTRDLNLEILHRVEGIFGHRGAYHKPYEVLGKSLERQWIYDSLTLPSPEQELQRHNIALALLDRCRKGSTHPPLTADVFMQVLNLGYAFAHDTVVANIQKGTLQYPLNKNGQVDWSFEQSTNLLEILRDNYNDIKFAVAHPGGTDELSRWVPVGHTSTAPGAAW